MCSSAGGTDIKLALDHCQGLINAPVVALSDDGPRGFDAKNAAALAALAIPSFACTPDLLPDLMAAATTGGARADVSGARGSRLQAGAPPSIE